MRRFILPALAALTLLGGCQWIRNVLPSPTEPETDPEAATILPVADLADTPDSEATMAPDMKDRALTEEDGLCRLAEGNNRFAWSVFTVLDDQPGNVFVSPASISGAFSLLYPGADGETEAEIGALFAARALGIGLAAWVLLGSFAGFFWLREGARSA